MNFTLDDLEALYKLRKEKHSAMEKLNAENETLDDAQNATFEQLKAEYEKADREIEIGKQTLKLATDVDHSLFAGSQMDEDAKNALEYIENFNSYMDGSMRLEDAKNVLQVGVDVKGGYVVPVAYRTRVIELLNTMGRTRGISSNINTSTTEKIPLDGETPTFGWIEELGTYPETDTEFGQTQIGAYKSGGIIKVSEELLQDAFINIEEYLARKIALGMDNLEKVAFATGDGVNKPTGYTVGLAVGANSTTAAVDAITSDELFDVFHDLKEEYRKNSTWRMNDDTLKNISRLKDGNGVYLFPTLRDGSKPMLFNRPIVIDDSLPNMGAGNKFLVVGDFSYYQVGDRGDMTIQRLNELYAGSGEIGYKVTARVDGKRLLDEPFNIAQNAAV